MCVCKVDGHRKMMPRSFVVVACRGHWDRRERWLEIADCIENSSILTDVVCFLVCKREDYSAPSVADTARKMDKIRSTDLLPWSFFFLNLISTFSLIFLFLRFLYKQPNCTTKDDNLPCGRHRLRPKLQHEEIAKTI